MPSGLVFTIWCANNVVFDERDDIAFLETMKKIQASLEHSFVCYRPTTPYENIISEYSESRKKYFMERLESFVKSGEQALNEPNQKDACSKWQKHFGDRFPCNRAEDLLDQSRKYSSPAFLRTDARSA